MARNCDGTGKPAVILLSTAIGNDSVILDAIDDIFITDSKSRDEKKLCNQYK